MLRPWAGRLSTLRGILRAGAAWQASAPPIDVMSLRPSETGAVVASQACIVHAGVS